MSEESEPRERVQVWQQQRGPLHAWRWRYVVGDDGSEQLVLPSNDTEPSREAAIAAAHLAYPEAPVELHTPGDSASVHRGRKVMAAPVIAAGVVARIRRRLHR